MSLRSRVVALVAGVLLFGLGLGAFVAGYQAKHALAAELTAGLLGGEQTVRSAFEDLGNSDHQPRDLRQLIATFNGNRHVEASLLNAEGGVIQTSQIMTLPAAAPAWFVQLLGRPPDKVEIHVPEAVRGFSAVVLRPTPAIDAAAAWQEFSGAVVVLVLSALTGLILVYVAIGAALQPLSALAAEFTRIGSGDYSGRVREEGPADLTSLQRGFNAMAAQLAASLERNRQLTNQLLTIQDEERADIARDLHDEIGPHLFSVNMDAELIAQLLESDRPSAVPDRIRSIQAAVGHMQREVRDLLGRLRPARVTEFGLNAALEELARFWSSRRPDIKIDLKLAGEEGLVSEPIKEVAYRIAQEAANNALRHSQLAVLHICVEVQNDSDLVIIVRNDGPSRSPEQSSTGYGLVGMRERVTALGGSLLFGSVTSGSGWTVVARLPLPQTTVTPASAEMI